jgi:hypothetical protein
MSLNKGIRHGVTRHKIRISIKTAVITQYVTKYQFVSLGTALDLCNDAITTRNSSKKGVVGRFYRKEGYITSWTNPPT